MTSFNPKIITLAASALLVAGMPSTARTQTAASAIAKESAAAEAELRELAGTWELTAQVSAVVNGRQQPLRERKTIAVIRNDKLIIAGESLGIGRQELTLKLGPSQRPKAVNLSGPKLPALAGIYDFTGDTLAIYADATKRPTAFPAGRDPRVWNFRRLSRVPANLTSSLPSAPGTYWMIEPTAPPARMATLGIVLIIDTDREGAAVVTLAASRAAAVPPEYRPVLFDAAKKRYTPVLFTGEGRNFSRGSDGAVVSLCRWRMDPGVLPADKVSLLGVEAITPEFRRLGAEDALRQARRQGIETLPYPQLNQPFDFTLTTIDGQKKSLADFRGKMVLIDCWATWCAPCMTLLPELKQLHRKYHQQGLEMIGMNFDSDVADVRTTCRELGVDWPQALVPVDDKQRELWQKASGIDSLPRLLVIDRQGILRLDVQGGLDEQQLVEVLKMSAEVQ